MLRLREVRKSNDLTLKSIGDYVGVSESTMSLYENGKRDLPNEILIKLSQLYHVSSDYLLGLSLNKNQPTVEDDGLREKIIDRVQSLSDPELCRVQDFLNGLEAGQEIASVVTTAPDSAPESAE